tara:strand:- start:2086 stop:3933 length:1848 start_codon:yes stop_codon:yes gene_type:complete
MIFYRILDNQLYHVNEMDTIGFDSNNPSFIPDEYLEGQVFVIMRTAHGIGDWGVISALPRLLKQKYPECKVYIPSPKMLEGLFQVSHKNAYHIFANNPYIDGVIHAAPGDIFHDQYRIYDHTLSKEIRSSYNEVNIPLAEQMLEFWQFEYHELVDSQPELYWSDEEIQLGDAIIEAHTNGDFGCLLVSDRFGTQNGKHDTKSYDRDTTNMTQVLKENTLPYFYWSYKPLRETPFNFIDKALDLRHVDLRIQLYIKSKAQLNISNQCGTNHLVVRYSKVYESQRQYPLNHNFVHGIEYLCSDYESIDIDYFMNMQLAGGGGGKEICNQNGKLKTVGDIVKYWQVPENIKAVQSSLNKKNWQYFNSMMAGYKKGVITESGPDSWKLLTKKYYDSLPNMSEEEIEVFQKDNPVDFDNGLIRHGTHRAYAMIGRLIRGEKYIPFQMRTERIYHVPRAKDGKHRILPLTTKVKGLQHLLDIGIQKDEFIIVQSGILPIIDVRPNNDIDIIISTSARNRLFNGHQEFIRLENGIEIFAPKYGKFMKFGAQDDDDLINNYALVIDGIRFLEPRFYFQRLFRDSEKDKSDWPGVRRFFNLEKYKCYPYNTISLEQWGYEWQSE